MQILVTGNEIHLLNETKRMLKADYSEILLSPVKDALEYISQNKPNLILLDVNFTEPNSLDTLRKLHKLTKQEEIPVIVMMDSNHPMEEQKALALGASDIIYKPLLAEVLHCRVRSQLELYSYRVQAHDFEKLQDAISVSLAELVECRDITTGGHLKNSTRYFHILLEEVTGRNEYLGVIPHEDIRDLLRSAPLHDIGKIGINDDVLRKASTLNYGEFEYMKTHTILGKETFDKIMKETGENRFLIIARNLAYCHHERWDGTGYPNGLKGEEIPLYVRIFAIADVYDALTSYRSYKEALSHQEAVKIISEGRGTAFDPNLIDIFLAVKDRFEEALLSK